MTNGTIMLLAALAGAMPLAGCPGGDGDKVLTEDEIEQFQSDPRWSGREE